MPGLSKVIVLDADARARRQVQLGFEREGVPTAGIAGDAATLELPGDDAGLVVVGGVDGEALELVRRVRAQLDDHNLDAPIVFAGRGVRRSDAEAAGADEVVLRPAYLRDVVTIGRLLSGQPAGQRAHLVGNLVDVTCAFTLVRALAALGRSATLTLTRGLRRGEVRFYHGEVTSAQVGLIHGQAALHQLLLWTDARFDFHHEDVVRRQQIPLPHDELLADAERFLESVRDSSGGLSPAVVLEQNVQCMQSFGKQIPTEVYGVLRMFDGHRVLADVLEDSAYRVFETLRVAQRAVEAGLLRATDKQPRRASWRPILEIEQWLVGSDGLDTHDSEAIAQVAITERDTAPMVVPDARGKTARKARRKKRRRGPTPASPISAAPAKAEIDWGALVPRIVGAEVGPLSGVVPAAHVSGEIIASTPHAAPVEPDAQPTIVFDEAAELGRDAEERGRTDAAEVADDVPPRDTKPERVVARATLEGPGLAISETETATVIVQDVVTVDTSGATTARITAIPTATIVVHGAGDLSGATTERFASPPVDDIDETGDVMPAEPRTTERQAAVSPDELDAGAPETSGAGATDAELAAPQGAPTPVDPQPAALDPDLMAPQAVAAPVTVAAPVAAAAPVTEAVAAPVAAPVTVAAPVAEAVAAPVAAPVTVTASVAEAVADAVAVTAHVAVADAVAVTEAVADAAPVTAIPPVTEAVADAVAVTAPVTEAVAVAVAAPVTEAVAAPVTAPVTEALADAVAVTAPVTEAVADADAASRIPPAVADSRVPPADAASRIPPAVAAPDADRRIPTAAADRRLPPAVADSRVPPADAASRIPPAVADSRVPHADADRRMPPADADSRLPPAVAAPDADSGKPPAAASGESRPAKSKSDAVASIESFQIAWQAAEASAVTAPRPADPAPVAPPAAPPDAAPSAITDEPSDGVIREHIATAETAPVKRRRLPSDPPEEDDRPEVAAGEITLPRPRPTIEPRPSEPSILVADLAAVHAAVSEVASDHVTAPRASAASPAREARVSEVRADAVAFSDLEEAFFRAGHEKEKVVVAPPVAESFDDLDEDYQPVGFWDRLRGKGPRPSDRTSSEIAVIRPPQSDEPEKK